MSENKIQAATNKLNSDALAMHAEGRPGKLEIKATKPLATQRDLSLAYSPGVAEPCRIIADNPDAAYDYTAKSNTVAVISNGTAVLGLGDLGALASKPVMEGKAVLFKRFADVDGIDLELDSKDVDKFCQTVELIAPSFGGINLEDIAAPESFIIEARLKDSLDIPVMHDDQHGTAIIAAAGLLNALEIQGKTLENAKMVVLGAGAASIATIELLKAMGAGQDNIIMVDRTGVVYKGRSQSMNQWKEAHATSSSVRRLEEAMVGSDVFIGLAGKDSVNQEMIKSMADKPIVFAMANPDPEIRPELVHEVRKDAICATGRSDYPNQVNNVLGFPYIFRGALDVRATAINTQMKIAAAYAIAELAKQGVPQSVGDAYGTNLSFGPGYIIPTPFDPRLISIVPKAVAKAAMESGVARRQIKDFDAYEREIMARVDPSYNTLNTIYEAARQKPQRTIFAEGEEEIVIRAAADYLAQGFGTPILVGHQDYIEETATRIGVSLEGMEIRNARLSQDENEHYAQYLYKRLARTGYLMRDCQRLINRDRNTYSSVLLAMGEGDQLITGLTRTWRVSYEELSRVIGPAKDKRVMGYSLLINQGRIVFIADTAIHERPNAEHLARIAIQTAQHANDLGYKPRVAFLSYSTFGSVAREASRASREAVEILDKMDVDFEYDGEMQVPAAMDYDLMRRQFPVCRLSGPANVLIMPGLHSANISSRLLEIFSSGTVLGPLLSGTEKPIQIVTMNAKVDDILITAALGAHALGRGTGNQ